MCYKVIIRRMHNSHYGKTGQYNSIYRDCDFCKNAHTDDELHHDDDLSYIACGDVDKGYRMLFRTGDNRPTKLIIEQFRPIGINFDVPNWELVGEFTPNYCPFCGRPLFENMLEKRIKHLKGMK